jgi:UDP-sugar pyrophosphorylase
MNDLINRCRAEAGLSQFAANLEAGLLDAEAANLASELISNGQAHLFAHWDEPGTCDARKTAFLSVLKTADSSYPGGIVAYVRNARELLAAAAAGDNPFEGCTPLQPDLVDLSEFGEAYDAAERAGLAAFAGTAVVLVAGGLGERLGYHGIKLDIPVEVTLCTSYLAHFAGVIRAASVRCGRAIPLVIMTSRDTHAGTVETLRANANFGLADDQVIVLCQELVPALADIDGRLALEDKYKLVLKPHGHGDIHMLMHSTGTAKALAARGVRYLLLIQDTNGQVFNAAMAAIGVSEREGYDFNSIAVNRIPGEAVGGITRLQHNDRPDLTLNVEYNQLDPLLRATVSPEGDVPNEQGFSLFPGNVNLLVIRMEPYLRVLEASQGVVAEFVNPKFSDKSRTTFKKPARLETMMQDLPKLFNSGEKVGVTVFHRKWCFSACKNNLTDAAAKASAGGPPESASSAESDFYLTARMKLAMAGMDIVEVEETRVRGVPIIPGPRVILRPTFALTLEDVRERVRGGQISGDATLVLDGNIHLENVTVTGPGALVISACPGAEVFVRGLEVKEGTGFDMEELTDAEMISDEVPEFLRIRGYKILPRGARRYEINEPGRWVIEKDGRLTILAEESTINSQS